MTSKTTTRRSYGAVDETTKRHTAEIRAWRRSGTALSFREWREQQAKPPVKKRAPSKPQGMRQGGLFGEVGG